MPNGMFRVAGLMLFIAWAASACILATSGRTHTPAARAADPLSVDFKTALASGDLDYTAPARRSEEGMPLGNGRMGSLVWTSPSALKFQINRVDVFGQDASTDSFPRADSDYASGCGYVDINVVSAGNDVFTTGSFNQHLSVYDGLMTAKGAGLKARLLAWNKRDVMAIEIDDQRKRPEPINVDLRMLRYAMQGFTGMNWEMTKNHTVIVKTADHYATSQLLVRDGNIVLTQRFAEDKFFDSSAIAIGVVGRDSKPRFLNDATVQLSAAGGPGKFTILISSAATPDRKQDVGDLALKELAAARDKGSFEALFSENAAWWHDFWSKGYVAMHSPDGQADFVGGNYAYFMYLMASSSRGNYPPRFGGMLWYTNGDFRRWGSQYWHANTDAYYRDLMPANHLDLMAPFFSMYFGMYDACALAAQQQWGSKGIYIPEITFFSGPERIPDNLVKEFQDLFLARKPYEQASKEFLAYVATKNRHNSRYNFLNDGDTVHGLWVAPTKGAGIFGHCTHFLSGAAGVASQFWQRYEFSGDKEWLRSEAYPMIKGVAEFYANFPNVKKEADGKWHIYHVNRIESDWNSNDTQSELGAMRTIFPMAIRASQILGVDANLRPKWQDIADNLASPAPGSGERGTFDQTKNIIAQKVAREASAASGLTLPEGVTSSGGSGRPVAARAAAARTENAPAGNAAPTKTGRSGKSGGGKKRGGGAGSASDAGVAAQGGITGGTPVPQRAAGSGGARRGGGVFGNFVGGGEGVVEPIGSEPELKRRFLGFNAVGGFIDPVGDGGAQIFLNRMRLREGPGATDAEHIGGLAFGIHQSLLISTTNDTLTESSIQIFPAWPKDWNVNFKLLARGGTVVTAAQKGGKIVAVKLEPQMAGTITLINPWGSAAVKVTREGKASESLSGEKLEIKAQAGEAIRIEPAA